MAARRGRRDRVAPPLTGGHGPDPGGGVRSSSRGSRSQGPCGTVGTVSGGEQVLLHEEVDDSGFVSLSRLGSCLKDKDLEMEELMLQDETLLGTMQSYMDASLISLIEDFGSLGESRLSLEDQNEVSLLTALTEILDNADSENLSPFDSIPDSELLVSPREGSSLHKLLTLSRTPSERDLITPVDPLGPSTGNSRVNGVEMSLTDSPWDFSPPSFLETSSPKLPIWRPPRSRPRRSQSPFPQQCSDGEEEEEVVSFNSQLLAGDHDSSMSSIPDFPMHLACPKEEGKTAVTEMTAQVAGDDSISSLSELVRAMHPYCLPNFTHLTSLENELQEQLDDLTLPEDCMVLEIVGQAATAGNDLQIPVVLRQIPTGPQPLLLDDSLEDNPTLQVLLPTLESETEAAVPKEALCPEKEGLSPESEGKLESVLLEPREVMEPVVPKGPQNPPANRVLSSQRARKGRRKKSKEQQAAYREGCARRLRSSCGQLTVAAEVISQAGSLPQEELQREVGPPHGRGKPRAWARAWAAALEKPTSGNLESSARQASSAKEGSLDLYPNRGDTIKARPVPTHLSLVDSAHTDPMPLDSVEADPIAVEPVRADPVPIDLTLVDFGSANSELVDPLPADQVLVDSAAIDPAVVVPVSEDLPRVDPVLANLAIVDSVSDDLASVNPVLVKSRPTDPRRGAVSSAQGSLAPQLLLESESLDPPKAIIPEVKEVMVPLKVKGGTSATTQETRPRPLSLSEYRRRRQQRQAEAEERSSQAPSGKWPSLSETPTGLAEIPCLVIPPSSTKKTALQRSPKACFVPVGPSPASPAEPSASKSAASTLTKQVSSPEIPPPARPPPLAVQSVPPTMPTALPFPPGGLSMTPMVSLRTSGQGVPSLPLPPLQPPSLPVSVGPLPSDPYTHYTPIPPWPCYPPVSPTGYPCLPPTPMVPIVSGTPGAYAVSSTCNVPWVPPPGPVSPYSSSCTYGPLGWGTGLQHPPFWPTVLPPPLPLASVGRAVPPPKVEPSGIPAVPPESVLPMPMAPPLNLGSAGHRAQEVESTKVDVKPVSATPHLKHKVSSLMQSPQNKVSPYLSAESVAVEEPASERLKLEIQETKSREKTPPSVSKAVPTPTLRQSTITTLPGVYPAHLRKLSFLPTPRTQGPEDVVQAFISEIGIEASDLSSLLEQFEKSEAKKECPPPAPADSLTVGNSGSVDPPQEKRPLDRLQAPELANMAGLTPPATPPHQLWKPLAAVSLLAKVKSPKATAQERSLTPEGVTETKHPAAARLQERVHVPSPVHVGSGDHDYCIRSRTPPKKMPALVFPEAGSRWNVKHHQDITIKPVMSLGPVITLPPGIAASQKPLDHRTNSEQADPPGPCLAPSALLSPEASPCRNEMNTRTPSEPSAKQRSLRCYRKACRSASPQSRGWQGRHGCSSSVSSGSNRTSEASSSSSSSSSRSRSRSLSPPHKRWRRSSCSSSGRSRRCSSSSSSSTSSSSSSSSRSRSRSPSPCRRSDRRRRYSSYRSHDHYQRQRVLQKERAIEERRVVFIGKIPGRMTRSELKQRFSVFGDIEDCTIHFRVQGDNYGFVTYRYAKEAFAAIESGHKLRQADEQPFDLCFGGRRQFCKRSYSDLDSNWEDFDPAPVKSKFDSLDFDTLLKQAQKNLRR